MLTTIQKYLLPELLRLGQRSEEFWTKRISTWIQRSSWPSPRLLLYIDGLHEPGTPVAARRLLAGIREELSQGHCGGVAVLIACRKGFWDSLEDRGAPTEDVSQMPHGVPVDSKGSKLTVIPVTSFSEAELAAAEVAPAHRELLAHPNIAPFSVQPKFFPIILRLGAQLAECGALTPARIFFEEWRDRLSSQLGAPLSGSEFLARLRNWASKIGRPPLGSGATRPSASSLALIQDLPQLLSELQTGGVLAAEPSAPERFRLSSEALFLGLGLELLHDVEEASRSGLDAARECIAAAVEPGAEMDESALVLANALMSGFLLQGPHRATDNCLAVLLTALLTHPNAAAYWERFRPWSFFQDRPIPFLLSAEACFRSDRANHSAINRLEFGLIRNLELGLGLEALVGACEDWLLRLAPARAPGAPGALEREGRLASALALEPRLQLADRESTLGLRRLAVRLLGAAAEPDRWVPAIEAWALSSAAMAEEHVFADSISWVLRRGSSEFLASLFRTTRSWAAQDGWLHRSAALALLRCADSDEQHDLLNTLERELEPEKPKLRRETLRPWALPTLHSARRNGGPPPERVGYFLSWVAEDPSASLPRRWRRALTDELRAFEAHKIAAGPWRTSTDSELEAAEPTYARFVPSELVRLQRLVLRRVLVEPIGGGRSRSDVVEDGYLLLDPRLLERAHERFKALNQAGVPAEKVDHEELALAGILFASARSAGAQIRLLSSRRAEFDSADWSPLRKRASQSEVRVFTRALEGARGVTAKRLVWMLAGQPASALPLIRESKQVALRAISLPEVGSCGAELVSSAECSDLLVGAVRAQAIDPNDLLEACSQAWATSALRDPAIIDACGNDPGLTSHCQSAAELSDADLRSWVASVKSLLAGRGHFHSPLERVSASFLADVVKRLPGELGPAIDLLAGTEGVEGRRIRHLHGGFVGTLAHALFIIDHPKAKSVFFSWRDEPNRTQSISRLGVERANLIPFAAGMRSEARSAAERLFREALTDLELAGVVLAAEHWNHTPWLARTIRCALATEHPLEVARGIAAWGLATSVRGLDLPASQLPRHHHGWLCRVRLSAMHRHTVQRFATHWFREFLRTRTDTSAWCAFRLLLQTVDARFCASAEFHARLRELQGKRGRRWDHLILNWRTLQRRFEDSRKALDKVLFGLPIPLFDQPPWKRVWNLA